MTSNIIFVEFQKIIIEGMMYRKSISRFFILLFINIFVTIWIFNVILESSMSLWRSYLK
jgi:hypothetical protein